jgi:hypothetical protein
MSAIDGRRPRYVLDEIPYDDPGRFVLLTEGSAAEYKAERAKVDQAFEKATTNREFFEQLGDDTALEFFDDLDRPLDVEAIFEFDDSRDYSMYPNAMAYMLADISEPDLDFDLIDGPVTTFDTMVDAGAYVAVEEVDELRRRLIAAGYEVIGWDEVAEFPPDSGGNEVGPPPDGAIDSM